MATDKTTSSGSQKKGPIEKDLDRLKSDVVQLNKDVTERVSEKAHDAAELVSEKAHHAADTARLKSHEARVGLETTIRERPVESLLAAFAAGIVTSLIFGRSRRD